ncbi:hypothetical protein VQ03_02565 [Methylobacterium tarhaniae]|uniref:Uncharacterized protein n=1 Tax=Methylobacterium tarhaniae TaxID=1187852 RepID=A0A0J6TFT3_9HYPH|nr:hypothetical protein [Methylobacterium tarhaniae]KMO44543.1 hypothetical protein VQ03_02565 [Methylobacterium tarhaniae]
MRGARRALPVLIGLALCGPAAAQDVDFPTFTPRAACGLERGAGADPASYRGCLSDERAARRTLRRSWARFPIEDRRSCRQESEIGGMPSYVGLLTCLQLADDALPLRPPPMPPVAR